ncbi:MAG: transcriptional regulator, partial [Kurthia sp.]|nr:transcriptional regulator [Kurthia sp.]
VALFEQHPNHGHMMIASVCKNPIDLIQEQAPSKNLYRLFSSITIYIPPLRERKEDIMPFINDYFQRHRDQYGSSIEALSPEVTELFLNYDWPGNLKELEVLLDEMTNIITTETVIDVNLLPPHFKWKIQNSLPTEEQNSSELFIIENSNDLRPLDHYMKEVEAYYITKALEMHDGNISKTAEALGIRRQSLQYRMKNFQIDAKQFVK